MSDTKDADPWRAVSAHAEGIDNEIREIPIPDRVREQIAFHIEHLRGLVDRNRGAPIGTPLWDGTGPATEAEAAEHLMTCTRSHVRPGDRIRCARCGGFFHATDALAQHKGTGPLHVNLDRCREEMGPVQWERYTTANRGTGGPGDIEGREDGDCYTWCQIEDKDHDGPCEARNRVLPRKK